MTTKTRYIGTCGVCEHKQKLIPTSHELVHHGYQRPGKGYIVGDCFGVGYQAYELSRVACADYKRMTDTTIESLTATLGRFQRNEITELSALIETGPWNDRKSHMETYRRDSEDPAERHKFKAVFENQKSGLESQLRWRTMESQRMAGLITAWSLKPVITFEEHIEEIKAQKRAAKEKLDAERAAKRAVRDERRSKLEERRARHAAERLALITKYQEAFRELAAKPVHAGTRAEAVMLWRELNKQRNKKGYLHFYATELGLETELISLGLAAKKTRHFGTATENTYVEYASETGYVF